LVVEAYDYRVVYDSFWLGLEMERYGRRGITAEGIYG
jgi:hypothetical protein